MKSLVAILFSILIFASYLASNNMLALPKKKQDYEQAAKEQKIEKDTEKEAEKENVKKDWLSPTDFTDYRALAQSNKTILAHYHSQILFVVNDIEDRPPKC